MLLNMYMYLRGIIVFGEYDLVVFTNVCAFITQEHVCGVHLYMPMWSCIDAHHMLACVLGSINEYGCAFICASIGM